MSDILILFFLVFIVLPPLHEVTVLIQPECNQDGEKERERMAGCELWRGEIEGNVVSRSA